MYRNINLYNNIIMNNIEDIKKYIKEMGTTLLYKVNQKDKTYMLIDKGNGKKELTNKLINLLSSNKIEYTEDDYFVITKLTFHSGDKLGEGGVIACLITNYAVYNGKLTNTMDIPNYKYKKLHKDASGSVWFGEKYLEKFGFTYEYVNNIINKISNGNIKLNKLIPNDYYPNFVKDLKSSIPNFKFIMNNIEDSKKYMMNNIEDIKKYIKETGTTLLYKVNQKDKTYMFIAIGNGKKQLTDKLINLLSSGKIEYTKDDYFVIVKLTFHSGDKMGQGGIISALITNYALYNDKLTNTMEIPKYKYNKLHDDASGSVWFAKKYLEKFGFTYSYINNIINKLSNGIVKIQALIANNYYPNYVKDSKPSVPDFKFIRYLLI